MDGPQADSLPRNDAPDDVATPPATATPSAPSPCSARGEPVGKVIEAALKFLPACQRCRRLRRKCDPGLPSCRLCTKSQSECCFYDGLLQQVLPRSYIQTLVDRFHELERADAPTPVIGLDSSASHAAAWQTASPAHDSAQLAVASVDRPTAGEGNVLSGPQPLSQPSGDGCYSVLTASGLKTRYCGRSSVFALTVAALARANADGEVPFTTDATQAARISMAAPSPSVWSENKVDITESVVRSSVALYLESVNVVYPFIQPQVALNSIETYCAFKDEPRKLTRQETFQVFCVAMIMAISAASQSRLDREWTRLDEFCYHQASRHIESVTSMKSMESLQALMLSIVYCLFRPRKGDIWKLLDYACRLSIEMSYHRELTGDDSPDSPDQETRRGAFWCLYTIERIVGQLFGRPSDLPETIFTTKIPQSPTASTSPRLNEEQIQETSATHHYRIVYLRSEIYRDLYLPHIPPQYPLSWYGCRLNSILEWYHQLKTNRPEEQYSGVGTLTCGVAFHSTIIFLFQPVLLHYLYATRDKNPQISGTFPTDSFYSACRLIQIYSKISRAPRGSPLSTYPMTFMGAHYCWFAAMTIIAHCLLLLDKRLTPKRMTADALLLSELQDIDATNIFQISNSCLALLIFCAEQWPGMVGMVDIYNNLSAVVIPKVMATVSPDTRAS